MISDFSLPRGGRQLQLVRLTGRFYRRLRTCHTRQRIPDDQLGKRADFNFSIPSDPGT